MSTADTSITRIDFTKCMYTFISNRINISTSYYRVLVQELRVFESGLAGEGGPEGRTGIPRDVAWNDSSHSILYPVPRLGP